MNLLLKTTTHRSIATALVIGFTAATPLPSFAQSNSKQIWSCQAENATRRYVVDQLDLENPEFDMAIYIKNKGDDRDYNTTITIIADETRPQYIGNGVLNNDRIKVSAMGRTVAFSVDDSKAGVSFGRCWANWEMADPQTRRLVRLCFATASQESGGSLAEVTRAGCTTNPVGVLASLKPRGGARSSPMNTFLARTNDERAIVAMVAAYNQRNPERIPTIITRLVTSQSYGLYRWVMGERTGQTIVKQATNGAWMNWIIDRGTGETETSENLQKRGIPKAIAQDLIQKMDEQLDPDR